jgi:hypothetical protein
MLAVYDIIDIIFCVRNDVGGFAGFCCVASGFCLGARAADLEFISVGVFSWRGSAATGFVSRSAELV